MYFNKRVKQVYISKIITIFIHYFFTLFIPTHQKLQHTNIRFLYIGRIAMNLWLIQAIIFYFIGLFRDPENCISKRKKKLPAYILRTYAVKNLLQFLTSYRLFHARKKLLYVFTIYLMYIFINYFIQIGKKSNTYIAIYFEYIVKNVPQIVHSFDRIYKNRAII